MKKPIKDEIRSGRKEEEIGVAPIFFANIGDNFRLPGSTSA